MTKPIEQMCPECKVNFWSDGIQIICDDCKFGHPKQSTELDEMVRDFTQVVPRAKSEVRRRLEQLYHSGHTAGQAAEREKVRQMLAKKLRLGLPVWALSNQNYFELEKLFKEILDDVSSSLNKD